MSSSTEHAYLSKIDALQKELDSVKQKNKKLRQSTKSRFPKEDRTAEQTAEWLTTIKMLHSKVLRGLSNVQSASPEVVSLGKRRWRDTPDGIENMAESVSIFNELRVKVRDTIAFVDTIVQNYSATAHIIQYNGNDQIKVLLKDVDLEEMPENANPGVACVNRMHHLYWIVVKLLDAKKEHVKTAAWCASGDKSAHVDSTSAGVGRRF